MYRSIKPAEPTSQETEETEEKEEENGTRIGNSPVCEARVRERLGKGGKEGGFQRGPKNVWKSSR